MGCGEGKFVSVSDVADLRAAAIAAAGSVPPSLVCERVYERALALKFGTAQVVASGFSGSKSPSIDTMFVVGRACILGIELEFRRYLECCLQETCIALYDIDVTRASDGLLSLAAIARKERSCLSESSMRFFEQAVLHLSLLLDLYPDPSARWVVKTAEKLWRV